MFVEYGHMAIILKTYKYVYLYIWKNDLENLHENLKCRYVSLYNVCILNLGIQNSL